MSDFLDQLAEAARSLQLAGKRILIGVSGGPDSVALLSGLKRLADALRSEIQAAHLNHRLRPVAAEADAAWTQRFCDRLGVPLVIGKIDVAERARSGPSNVEAAARAARYDFLEQTAERLKCTHVAVAHSADDRVETVLHHLLRGTGLAGLAGMKPSRPLGPSTTLVRPLWRIHRAQIEAWLGELGQDFCIDETNADTDRTRSRIRHRLLPVLDQEFGPSVRAAILRFADSAAEAQSCIEVLADRLLSESIESDGGAVCRFQLVPLTNQPPHLVREVFVAAWKRMGWPRRHMGFDEWDRLRRLIGEGGRITLPGAIEATVRGGLLFLRPNDPTALAVENRANVSQNDDPRVEFGEKPL